jgi:hypothetical protein
VTEADILHRMVSPAILGSTYAPGNRMLVSGSSECLRRLIIGLILSMSRETFLASGLRFSVRVPPRRLQIRCNKDRRSLMQVCR